MYGADYLRGLVQQHNKRWYAKQYKKYKRKIPDYLLKKALKDARSGSYSTYISDSEFTTCSQPIFMKIIEPLKDNLEKDGYLCKIEKKAHEIYFTVSWCVKGSKE